MNHTDKHIESHAAAMLRGLAAALTLFAAISCGRSRTIENPYCERAEMLRVLRIETLDTATVVDVAVIGYNENWFAIEGDRQSGELCLTGRQSGRRYRYLGSDDLTVRHRYTHDTTGQKRFTMRFEPLDPADRQVDLTADVSASLNVEGIFLTPPDSLRKGPLCRVEGVLHDRPATTLLMLCRWTDYDGNSRDMVSKSRAIPVTDGRFEFEIPADDDLYVLIPWNEFAVSAWYQCEFFAEKGKVRIEWGAKAPTAIKGGRLNAEKDAIAKPTRDVSDIYRPKLDAYYDMPGDAYMSDRARETLALVRAESNPDSRDSLLKALNGFTDEERYSPEFYALISEYKAKNMEATEATLQHAENDVRQGYLPWVITLVQAIDRWENRDEIMRVAGIYAERFADRPLGQRLAEYVRAQSTEVGGRYADFEAPDREGTMHRFSEMIEGSRIVLLDLWASWCGPCRRAAIRNKPIYERYRDRGFAVVSVAREFDDTDDLDAAVAQDGYEWPVLVELDDRISLWRTYNAGDSGGLLVLIDPATGEILARGPSAEEIERTVARYCDGQ